MALLAPLACWGIVFRRRRMETLDSPQGRSMLRPVDLVQQLTVYSRNRLFVRYTAIFFALMLGLQAGAGWVFSKWFAGRLDDQRRVDTCLLYTSRCV